MEFEAYKEIEYPTDPQKMAALLTESKVEDPKAVIASCDALVSRYPDFVYGTARAYVKGSSAMAYSDMLFNAPMPRSSRTTLISSRSTETSLTYCETLRRAGP